MSVYLVGFSVSELLLFASNKVKKKQRWILVILALLIPCFIAGLRDKTIGTDVQVYLEQMTDAAISATSFKDYMSCSWYLIWRYQQVSDYEIAFSTLVYIVARIFKNIYAVQFVLQVFTVVPIYIAINEKKTEVSKYSWFGMLTYYLIFFNNSLNMMRQSIAMAFVLLAFSYFTNKDIKKCILFTIIGVLFHTSALLAVIIFFIYRFIKSDKQKSFHLGWKMISGYYANMIFVIIVGIIAILSVNVIVLILEQIGLSKYIGYISGDLKFMPNQIISRFPMFLIFIYTWKKTKRMQDFRFYFVMMCFDLLLSQFTSINAFAGRIAMYFSQFEILICPMICTAKKKNKLIIFLLTAYMLFYWWFYFVFNGTAKTVPYVLGI